MNALKPGRELDALVVEKVMGWDRFDIYEYEEVGGEQGLIRISDIPFNAVPEYSTDIAAAWEVVEKLKDLRSSSTSSFSSFFVQWFSREKKWEAGFGPEIQGQYGHTAPHAICLAALKAVGEKA